LNSNKIRISTDNEQFQEQPIDVTSTTIDQAVNFVDKTKEKNSSISFRLIGLLIENILEIKCQ
jgi:hypothetical protein